MPYISRFTGAQMDQAFGNALNQVPRFTIGITADYKIVEDFTLDELKDACKKGCLFDIIYYYDYRPSVQIGSRSAYYEYTGYGYYYQLPNSNPCWQILWTDNKRTYSIFIYDWYTSFDQITISNDIFPGNLSVHYEALMGNSIYPTDIFMLTLSTSSSLVDYLEYLSVGVIITGSHSGDQYWVDQAHTMNLPSQIFVSGSSSSYELNNGGNTGIEDGNTGEFIRRPILAYYPISKLPGGPALNYSLACPLIRHSSRIRIQVLFWTNGDTPELSGYSTINLSNILVNNFGSTAGRGNTSISLNNFSVWDFFVDPQYIDVNGCNLVVSATISLT